VAEHMMDINEVHDKMAHMGEDIVQKSMAQYGNKLTGKMEPCDACLKAKARAKKSTDHVARKLENDSIWTLWGHLNLHLVDHSMMQR